MKIFLTGEGPTDCGKQEFNKKLGQNVWKDGPVQVYIHKVMPDAQIDTFGKSEFSDLSAKRRVHRNRRSMQGLEGHGLKAFFVAQTATEKGYDIQAMYVDADKSSGSTQKDPNSCQKRYDLIREQVITGLQRGGASKPLAIIPMKMIECWILGDRSAFMRFLAQRQRRPYSKNQNFYGAMNTIPTAIIRRIAWNGFSANAIHRAHKTSLCSSQRPHK